MDIVGNPPHGDLGELGLVNTRDPAGCQVRRVPLGTAAADAGIEAGDTLISLGGEAITSVRSMSPC